MIARPQIEMLGVLPAQAATAAKATLGAAQPRFDVALLQATKTLRDAAPESQSLEINPKVQAAFEATLEQLAQKAPDQLKTLAQDKTAVQDVVDNAAQAAGLGSEDKTVLGQLTAAALPRLAAYKAGMLSMGAIAANDRGGAQPGPQGGTPALAGSPADSIQPVTAPKARQQATEDASPTLSALAAQALTPVIVSTRTDDGSHAAGLVSLASASNNVPSAVTGSGQGGQVQGIQTAQPQGRVLQISTQAQPEATAPVSLAPEVEAAMQQGLALQQAPVAQASAQAAPETSAPNTQGGQAPSKAAPATAAVKSPSADLQFEIQPLTEAVAVVEGSVVTLKGNAAPEAKALSNAAVSPAPAPAAAPVAQNSTPAPAPTAAPVAQNSTPVPAPTAAPVAQNSTPVQAPTAAPVAQNSTPVPAPTAAPVAQNSTPVPAPTAAPAAQGAAPLPVPSAATAPAPQAPAASAPVPQALAAMPTVAAPVQAAQAQAAQAPVQAAPSVQGPVKAAPTAPQAQAQVNADANAASTLARPKAQEQTDLFGGLDQQGQSPLKALAQQVANDVAVQQNVFQQVTQALKDDPSVESGRLVIRLKPASLGDVTVDLVMAGGKISARLVASSPDVRDAFVRDLTAFKAGLESHGIAVTEVSVALRAGVQDQPQGQAQAQSQPDQGWWRGLSKDQNPDLSLPVAPGAYAADLGNARQFSALA